jgi:HPP family
VCADELALELTRFRSRCREAKAFRRYLKGLCGVGPVHEKRRHNLYWSFAEASIVLVISAVAWATSQPLIFASLGPTAYEVIEQPQMKSARIYNVIVGHLVGLGCGFLGLWILNAWSTPKLLPAGHLMWNRMWAIALAASFTTVINLLLNSSQPAALSTTLLVALGEMQTFRDAVAIVSGVFLIAMIGEPLRRARLKFIRAHSSSS